MDNLNHFGYKTLLILVITMLLCNSAIGGLDEQRRLMGLGNAIAKCECSVVYNGYHFEARVVAPFLRVFVFKAYNDETAEQFINKWAYRSHTGDLIYVKYKDGTTELAKTALLRALNENQTITV